MARDLPAPEAERLRQELAELLADVQAGLEWARLRGAEVLPVLAVPAPAAPRPERPPAAPRPERAAPAAPRPERPTPAPRAERAAPAAQPPPAKGPPATPEPAPVRLDGRWASLASQQVLSGQALQRALKEAVQRPDPAARLAGVREALGDCQRCGLCAGRSQVVFGVGDPAARLVVLGEGPGEQEDLKGEPFVGPAGKMLDDMLHHVLGLRRDQVYILNMVKCRPPNNRNPQDDEIAACRPFLRAQLASIRPEFVLLMGSVASKALLGGSITRVRGRWHGIPWPGGGSRTMPTFHPAYLLRKPEDKALALADLKLLRAALDP